MNYLLTLAISFYLSIAHAEPSKETAPQNGLSCIMLNEPMIISGNNNPICSGQKICYMRVRCTEYSDGKVVNNHGDTDSVCKALSTGVCPAATACANDPDIVIEKASIVEQKLDARTNGISGRGTSESKDATYEKKPLNPPTNAPTKNQEDRTGDNTGRGIR